MLRANRRYGADSRYARLAEFARDLGRVCGRNVAVSQVSRWESCQALANFEIIRGYEAVLGLPRNHLVAVADALFREATAGLGASHLDRGFRAGAADRRRAQQLLDRALSADPMSGPDWDDLSGLLTTLDNVLLRSRDWAELSSRLLTEQLVADGAAWRQRSEATHRLLSVSDGRPHVIDACAALVRDPAGQSFIEPLAILDMATDAAATNLYVSQLVNPTNDQALRGALLGSINKVRQSHFAPDQLRRVIGVTLGVLLDSAVDGGVRPLAADLVRALPPALQERVAGRLLPAVVGDRTVGHILSSGRTTRSDIALIRVARVVAATMARMPDNIDGAPDALLHTLVGEILHSPNSDVRLHASQLVGATPFAAPLADAFCVELKKPAVVGDVSLASAIVGALPFIGGTAHRPVVERLMLTDGLPAAVVDAAAWNIGHMRGGSDEAFWVRAIQRHRPTNGGGWDYTLRGLVYALGMSDQRYLLPVIAADPEVSPSVRATASWWDRLPAVVVRSSKT